MPSKWPKVPPEPLRMISLPPRPWHAVNIEFCSPFPGGAYLLVVIDAYSRFPEVEIVSSTSAQSTILKLKRIFATHDIPEVLKSDNGPPFQSHAFHQFLKDHGIKHKPSSPLWPQRNGEAENFMKPLVKAVKSAHHVGKWNYSIFYLITEPPLTLPRARVLLTCCTIEQFELNYLSSQQKIQLQFIKR